MVASLKKTNVNIGVLFSTNNMPRKTVKTSQTATQVIKNEWILNKPLKTTIDVFKWVESHKEELEKNIRQHSSFLAACGEANVTPQKKFQELMQNLLNPPDFFWMEFSQTFKQTIGAYSQHMGISEEERKKFIENSVFSSFSRIIRLPLNKKLA
ncbi:hypothetical protein KKE06_03820 [Candidatus Micrarchaeota archaeon]|nr:hypothetical protein [Candidatus Micrarchaeota archaeon]MBU1930377.1 hypothetical protein [Candidatus Micrarchaeota archaeon]